MLIRLLLLGCVTCCWAADDAALVTKLDNYIKTFEDSNDFSGVVLVAKGDKPIFHKAYGVVNLHTSVEISTDHRFLLASLTKTFTAMAVLKLRDQGKLSLEDPVVKHLPDWPRGETLLVWHLLAHQGGLPPFYQMKIPSSFFQTNHSLKQLAELIGESEPVFEPGTENRYSNEGYVLLAYLIEKVSGMPYEEYLEEQFFKPFDMPNTMLAKSNRIVPFLTLGHVPGPPPEGLIRPGWVDYSYAVGSGALTSTSTDLYHWARAVLEKKTPDLWAEPWPWGWGKKEVGSHQGIEQTGMMPGYATLLQIYPEDDVVIIALGNVQSRNFKRFPNDLAGIIFNEPVPEVFEVNAVPIKQGFAQAAAGSYRTNKVAPFRLVNQAGQLFLQYAGATATEYLTPLSDNRFFMRSWEILLTFNMNGKGEVESVRFQAPWADEVCPKVPSNR